MTDIKIDGNVITIDNVVTITLDQATKPLVINPETNKTIASAKTKRVIKRNGISCADQVLRILRDADQMGMSRPTPKGLARKTGYSVQTVYASITELRNRGYDITKQGGRNGRYIYWGFKHGA